MEYHLLLTPFGQTRNVLTIYISRATSVSGGGGGGRQKLEILLKFLAPLDYFRVLDIVSVRQADTRL